MYTQGSHNPQPQQGTQKPMSSLYQQRPPGPPPSLPHFQQGPLAYALYQHGPAAPHQIPPGGLPNTGQSYLHPPMHVHRGALLPHMYQTAQQNSQHHSQLGTQNAHNMPQLVLPSPISASHTELSQAQPHPRALPPPPPPPQLQGQTFYRAPVNPLPQKPGLPHISSHPPLPPTTSFFTPAPLGSLVHSTGGDHNVLSTASLPLPPPPSSSPPILPSPPPSTSTPFSSSKPVQISSNLPCNLDSDGSKLSASGSMDEVAAPNQVKHNLIADNGSLNKGVGNGCDMGSLVGDKLSLEECLTNDHSSTPLKPTDEKVVERIEALCQCIAKNGPDYEEMVRQKESGKPEYAFLHGGELGSEAAIAHDFFQWMKKKSILSCKLDEQQGNSTLTPSKNEPSEQPFNLVIAAASYLPDDSDMEMEDDITQIDDEQETNRSLGGLDSQCDINNNMLNVKEQLHPLKISAECNSYKDVSSEKESAAGSSGLGEQGPEGIANADKEAIGAAVSKVIAVKNLAVPTEQPVVTSLEKLDTSSQLAKGGSPFRLLQDYASDDNSEKDVEICIESTRVSLGANLHRDAGSSLENVSSHCMTEKGFGPLYISSMPCAVASSEVVEGTVTTTSVNGNERANNKHVHQISICHAASVEVFQKENVMVGASVDSARFSKVNRQEEENGTLGFTQQKVDKFGRLARDGASDSDDDSHYIGTHRRGRSWTRSQSRSPPDRRRRSPRRRREKRSRSRSWSPRNRRSRSRSLRNRRSRSRSPRNRRSRSRSPRNHRSKSRSPNFRRAGKFIGENKRRVKGQMPDCFDFRRGRCYRGASCRYLHRDFSKGDEPLRQRNKQQYLEFPQSSRTNIPEEIKRISERVGDHDHDEVRDPEVKPYSDFFASRDMNINHKREDSVGGGVNINHKREDSVGGGVHNQDSQSTEYHIVTSEKCRDIPAPVFGGHLVENKQEGPSPVTNEDCQQAAELHHPSIVDASSVGYIDKLKSCDNASMKILLSFKNSGQKSLSSPLDQVCQNADCPPLQSDNSSISDSSPLKTTTSSPNRHTKSNAHPNTMELYNHPSQIPSPSFPHSQCIDNPHMKQHQTASSMFQSSGESFPSYMLPNQHSYFALQPNSSSTSLPPPSPLPLQDATVNSGTVTPGVSSHFQQSHLPLRNDFGSQIGPRSYPTEFPVHSQSDGFQQQAYLPIREANRPFLHASLPVYNMPIQQFGAPSMSRDDGLTQPPTHNVIASNSFAQGNTHPHTIPFSEQLLGNKMQPFPGESLPSGVLSNSSSYIHPYSQQQQTPNSSQHPMVDNIHNLTGKMNSSMKDPPDIRDTTSHHVDIGGSTSSTFPDPYASALDQPLNSKYSSDVLRQEKDKTYNNSPFSLTHGPVDGRSIGSQQATSSPNSARAIGQNFPRSGGDQYDPLFDSIEPSSRLSRKFDYIQKLEVTGDSDILLGLTGSNKPLDIEENDKRKDGGAAASAASADNEEFGETADAEVGDVENGSPSNQVEVNMTTGEIEIDQIKSPGKSKENKGSRSMKLFKVALADFVKEVLKPSWRQGNMSKEAFKTIVKKTVDKVSGAMKSHQIPKSRGKIDQYIESSQRKLTKLVMGYVDKYVKV